MLPTTLTLDDRPLPGEDPAKSNRRYIWIMLCSCLSLFLFVLLMASMAYQQRRNEAALNFENSSLRQRLNAESIQRQLAEIELAAANLQLEQRIKP